MQASQLSGKERRVHRRYNVFLSELVEIEVGPYIGHVIDISEGGAFVKFTPDSAFDPSAIAAGSDAKIKILRNRFSIALEIVRSTEEEDGSSFVAFKFEKENDLLIEFMETYTQFLELGSQLKPVGNPNFLEMASPNCYFMINVDDRDDLLEEAVLTWGNQGLHYLEGQLYSGNIQLVDKKDAQAPQYQFDYDNPVDIYSLQIGLFLLSGIDAKFHDEIKPFFNRIFNRFYEIKM